jgi:hypothetical protein
MNKNRSSVECFYCRRNGHTTLNCKIHAKDILKGKLKESTNIVISEDSSDAIFEDSLDSDSDDEFNTEPLKLF